MKEKLLALIERHNAVVDALSGCDLPVPEGKVFRAMEIWHKLAAERLSTPGMTSKPAEAGRILGFVQIVERSVRRATTRSLTATTTTSRTRTEKRSPPDDGWMTTSRNRPEPAGRSREVPPDKMSAPVLWHWVSVHGPANRPAHPV